jgi:hypothetical protein
MSQSIYVTPTTDDPESVWVAYRAALLAGGFERMALQTLADAVSSKAPYSDIRAAEEELSHAERRHDKASRAYITARRATRSVPAPAGTTDAATHNEGMGVVDGEETA